MGSGDSNLKEATESSPTTTTAKPTTRQRQRTTPTTTPAPTTTVVTTRKTTTQISTSTPTSITKTPFHSNTYLDVSSTETTTPTRPTSVSSNINETSARHGSMTEIGLIGAAIGGVLLLLVVLLCSFLIYRNRRSKAINKDEYRRQNTNDSNLNGESGLAAEMTSIPTYEVEQADEDENVKPLYTQVNKKHVKEGGPKNTSEIHLQNGNKALEFQTVIEKSRDTEKLQESDESTELVDNVLYESESVLESNVYERSPEVEISLTKGNQGEKTVSGRLNEVHGRVTYENIETSTDNTTYENQSDHQSKPESDWAGAYDKLDRLDHVIANQKVIGESVYDM